MSTHMNSWKQYLENYRPVRLTLVLGKVMKQSILSATTQHSQNKGIRPRQHGFRKDRSCLTTLNFYDPITRSVDEEKSVDVIYLDFSKALDVVSHVILLEKLTAHVWDRHTLCWVKTKLDGQAQRLVMNGTTSS